MSAFEKRKRLAQERRIENKSIPMTLSIVGMKLPFISIPRAYTVMSKTVLITQAPDKIFFALSRNFKIIYLKKCSLTYNTTNK